MIALPLDCKPFGKHELARSRKKGGSHAPIARIRRPGGKDLSQFKTLKKLSKLFRSVQIESHNIKQKNAKDVWGKIFEKFYLTHS